MSPAEIEDVLHTEPSGIVSDAAVAGVVTPEARSSDELNPRAWVVLTAEGRRLDEREVRERLERWVKTNLSKYKWLRGGIQFVPEVRLGVVSRSGLILLLRGFFFATASKESYRSASVIVLLPPNLPIDMLYRLLSV